MKRIIFYFILITLIMIGCKEKPVVIPEFLPPDSDRVVLLEELTGVACVNCPAGAAKVKELLQLYDGQLVAVAIHGDVLSEPLPESKYDFRYPDAADLEHLLAPIGKPAAVINRGKNGGSFLSYLIPDTWSGHIENELAKAHLINIDLETEYDLDTRKLTIYVGVIALDDIEGDLRINVGITESHIIDAQINSSETIPDFEHNHVLKEMITEINGEFLISDLGKNQILNKEYSFTLPTDENLWVAENCHVFVFVCRVSDNFEEVLQASETEVSR